MNGPPWARRGLCPGMQAGERALGGLVPPPPNSRATHSPLEGLSQRLRAVGMSRAEDQLPLAGPCPECLLPPAGSEISKAREPSRHRRPLQAPTRALGSVWLGTAVPTLWPLEGPAARPPCWGSTLNWYSPAWEPGAWSRWLLCSGHCPAGSPVVCLQGWALAWAPAAADWSHACSHACP